MKANGLYPTPPSRFISDDGYAALCNVAACRWADK